MTEWQLSNYLQDTPRLNKPNTSNSRGVECQLNHQTKNARELLSNCPKLKTQVWWERKYWHLV